MNTNKLAVIPTKSKFIDVNSKYVDQTACKTCPNDFQFLLAKKLDPVATLPLFLCSPKKKQHKFGAFCGHSTLSFTLNTKILFHAHATINQAHIQDFLRVVGARTQS